MYLFLDTETTGLPPTQPSKITEWPRLVQIGWVLSDETGEIVLQDDAIIRPEGYSIPSRVTRIHGISTQKAYNQGISLDGALNRFSEALRFSHFLIGHNIDYDYHVLLAEFHRKKIDTMFSHYPRFCTMKSPRVMEYVRIMKGADHCRYSKLSELYHMLFDERVQSAHDALADARTCAQCFFQLKKIGVI
jgi:DNA polymerase III epsilon subunit-like protein